MKLRKATRKRLHEAAAKKEAISISWPASALEPLPGHKYRVKGFDAETRLEVTARTETSVGGWKVKARLDSDPVKGMRIKASKGPENPAMGGPQFRSETEPEQVDNRYQRLLDAEGALKTAMQGNMQRSQRERFLNEKRLNDQRPRNRRAERAQARHLRSTTSEETA